MKNERIKSNTTRIQLNDHSRFELPVIIESPLQQRSNLSFHNQNSSRLYQTKNSYPHSASNYDVSLNSFLSRPTTRYPSTPLLASPHQFLMSPIATFDDDDDESDTISSNSSFQSCIDEFSDINTTESSSSLLEKSFQDLSSSYDLHSNIFDETIKRSRSTFRHLCTVQ